MCVHLLRDREVRVRKFHRCCWCNEGIYPGEQAQARTYRSPDGLISDHMHPECYEASAEVIADEGTCFEWMPGDFSRGSTDRSTGTPCYMTTLEMT